MDDSSHGVTAVSAPLQGAVFQVQQAALRLPVSRTFHLGEGDRKATRHEKKQEPIQLRGHTKSSPVQSSKTQADREANYSLQKDQGGKHQARKTAITPKGQHCHKYKYIYIFKLKNLG